MPAITLSKSNNREIKINERANLNLPLCTGERFKKKGHAGILKGLSLQEPSVVSRAEVLQHSRAVARMWGPLCPPSSPQPREPLWGMQVQQRVQGVQVCSPGAEHLWWGVQPLRAPAQPRVGVHPSMEWAQLPGQGLLLWVLPFVWSCRRKTAGDRLDPGLRTAVGCWCCWRAFPASPGP